MLKTVGCGGKLGCSSCRGLVGSCRGCGRRPEENGSEDVENVTSRPSDVEASFGAGPTCTRAVAPRMHGWIDFKSKYY